VLHSRSRGGERTDCEEFLDDFQGRPAGGLRPPAAGYTLGKPGDDVDVKASRRPPTNARYEQEALFGGIGDLDQDATGAPGLLELS
jgi:hypothetical protein